MTSKKLKGLLMKIEMFKSYYFLKTLTCVSLGHQDSKAHLVMKLNIKNYLNTSADN